MKIYPATGLVDIQMPRGRYLFWHDVSPFNTQTLRYIIDHRHRALFMLRRAKVPMSTKFITPKDIAENHGKLDKLNYPVNLVGPGYLSQALFNVQDKAQLLEAAVEPLKVYPFILAEPFDPKLRCYSALVFYGKVIALLELTTPKIYGDGISSIENLINQKMYEREKLAENAAYGPIIDIPDTLELLDNKNIPPSTVLKKEEPLQMNYYTKPMYGGETKAIAVNRIHKQTVKTIQYIAHFASFNFATVDFSCYELNQPVDGKNGYFTNIMLDPDISVFEYPMEGQSPPVARTLIKRIISAHRWPTSSLIG